MRLPADVARQRFARARVVRLATITPQGQPHLVPIVFALNGDVVYSAVDAKPKSTLALQRLANLAAHPDATVLADEYTEDWSQLWWVRGDGMGRIATGTEADAARARLTERYPSYVELPPPGPVLAIDIVRWSGWSAGA